MAHMTTSTSCDYQWFGGASFEVALGCFSAGNGFSDDLRSMVRRLLLKGTEVVISDYH